ncbi:ABC transporter permease [Paenibacillus agaridevorans]|uniref:ABC transporter permease n=1 Tax=Paenibacillus agaridevorans TaxID=171404 RepID=A0A2R5F2E4_9BACL|nr:ABC transporter permease [Paenibacillus agaridevorans]GBG12319.1 ABC transporter permease [Paenibacillus agaridevorans]
MRIRALTLRIIRQFFRDKRTLALLIAAPLLVLSLMYLVFNGDSYTPKIGVIGIPDSLAKQAEGLDADVRAFGSPELAEKALEAQDIDAYVLWDGSAPAIRLEGSDPARNRAVLSVASAWLGQTGMSAGIGVPAGKGAPADTNAHLNDVADTSSNAHSEADKGTSAQAGPAAAPAIEYLHGGPAMTTFDSLGPVFIGVFAFFFVFLIAGVSFLKERTSGTLERLLATPLRRWEIVAGYIFGFGLFTGIQAVLIALYSVHVLGLMMDGSIWYVLLVMLLLSATALSLGTFLSAFAHTEFQMIQFIPLVIVPQIFFSGLFDLESMSPWLRWLSHLMPLTYGADALRGVMLRGEGWSGIAGDVLVLAGLSLLFMGANVLALRKHRKI